MKKLLVLTLILVLSVLFAGCEKKKDNAIAEEPVKKEIILATTTSTQDSGLLNYLLPIFTEDTGIAVKVVAVGTGQAIRMGKNGDADAMLVHDTPSEIEVVNGGYSPKRSDVMYNDFILIGPKDDNAGIGKRFKSDIVGALKYINDNKLIFVSRGDDSGTHKMELRLFKAAGTDKPEGNWYKSVGKGMGDTIIMANELKGYTLTDRATYLKMKDNIDMTVVVEGDNKLFNQYGVLVVDPKINSMVNNKGAIIFEEWLLSDKGQNLIRTFGVEEFGEPLFIPNYKK